MNHITISYLNGCDRTKGYWTDEEHVRCIIHHLPKATKPKLNNMMAIYLASVGYLYSVWCLLNHHIVIRQIIYVF